MRPWQPKLVDLQGYHRLSTTNVTGTSSRTLINNPTRSRYPVQRIVAHLHTNDFNNFTKVRFTNLVEPLTGITTNTDYWLIRISATTAKVATSLSNAIAGTAIAYTDGRNWNTHPCIQMRVDQYRVPAFLCRRPLQQREAQTLPPLHMTPRHLRWYRN